jgi:hypothetical protein
MTTQRDADPMPDRDMDHGDKLAWMIETNGWAAIPVPVVEDPPRPGYTYTVGFTVTFDHPELVIFGLQPVAARGLLEMVAMHLSAGGELPEGMFAGLLDNDLPAAVLPIPSEEYPELFQELEDLYGEGGYVVSQFVWPDRHGKMPWDHDYDERLRLAQPVLGI